MAEPHQKSLELPAYLTRAIPFWGNPAWLEAERWRRVVRSQPIAIICRDHLITYLQALPWEIRARDPKASLDDDIAYYTNYILAEFDNLVDKLWQDALDLPVGGNVEIVRWPPNVLPQVEFDGETYKCTKPWSKGHVYQIVNIDGATVYPTFDKDFPLAQKIMEDINTVVYFKPEEQARILLTPRPELRMQGYSMPPPERIYLALTLLWRGDQYYANLLLDTPPAGILDLLDMEASAAKEWVQSFKAMFENQIDPLKIGVLYEHSQVHGRPAAFIQFGRPPTDMMFDTVTLKYGKIVAAGYWLTLGNIGLDAKGDTLAGSIREDISAMKTGYGVIKEKTKNFIDYILPPYLEWTPKEISYETLTGKGRAFLVYAQALKATKDAGAIKPSEVQAQLVSEGFITVEVEKPDDKAIEEAAQKPQFGNNTDQTKQLTDKVPPAEGGQGDVTAKAAVSKELSKDIKFPSPTNAQLLKLIKRATRLLFPHTKKAFAILDDNELPTWLGERVMMRFGQVSAYDTLPEVVKADTDKLDELDKLLNSDAWWALPVALQAQLYPIYKAAFEQGATQAAEMVQELLYTEGLRDMVSIGLAFDLTNAATITELETRAATLVTQLNDGTRYYLKRILASSVEEGLASPEIAKLIRDGAGVDEILKQSDFTNTVIERVKAELADLQPSRIESIVNTEINRAESMGRLGQWSRMGLTRKGWRTFGNACEICKRNEAQGLVEMAYVYEDVFNGTQTPPAHPRVCHCNLEFDEKELISKAGELKVWNGS